MLCAYKLLVLSHFASPVVKDGQRTWIWKGRKFSFPMGGIPLRACIEHALQIQQSLLTWPIQDAGPITLEDPVPTPNPPEAVFQGPWKLPQEGGNIKFQCLY